jgi:hypothetical protein
MPSEVIAIESAPSSTNQKTTLPITREGEASGITRST